MLGRFGRRMWAESTLQVNSVPTGHTHAAYHLPMSLVPQQQTRMDSGAVQSSAHRCALVITQCYNRTLGTIPH
jgi:hypothetical protein